MNFLASVLAAFLVGLLKGLLEEAQARGDLQRATRLEGQLDDAKRVQLALQWKADAARDPTAGELRVQDGARTVPLPSGDADPPRDPV